MTNTPHPPIKLFQFPRMFAIPNLSPFCCKLETWLRIAQISYEVVDTPDHARVPRASCHSSRMPACASQILRS
jgi:hypothetical protein